MITDTRVANALEKLEKDLDAFEKNVLRMIEEKEMSSLEGQNMNGGNLSMNHSQASIESQGRQQSTKLCQTPIAIVGMASILPNAKDLQVYWENILNEVDCITEVPASRWNVDDYYDPNPRAADKTYCKRGGFIPDVDFNPMEFGLPPNVLEATDVSQLLALLVAKSAMEDAGYGQSREFNREMVGITLGTVSRQLATPLGARLQYPVWERVLRNSGLAEPDVQKIVAQLKTAYVDWQENSFPGMLGNVIAGRIANRFDFGALNCTLDAACASSLAALKMAISELVEHRADMMLAGGVDPDNSAFTYLCFSKTPALSLKQHSRPFDVDSDGILLGEGLGMVVLKRLEDAERDGDRIYAVIKGIGTSSDGRFKSIYAPRAEGQVKALQRAYEDAGISPATVGLVEAHGTGTMAGDPVEFAGLKEYFEGYAPEKQSIALGSVKSQIGHTKTTAGIASLIKCSLALHHKVLPPTINITQPSPKLQIEDSPFYLNTKLRPWIRRQGDSPRRAGVSSFGFGGTNFHVVLEEVQSEQVVPYRVNSVPRPVFLVGENHAQLLERAQAMLAQLRSPESELAYIDLVESSQALVIPASAARVGFVADTLADATHKLEIAISLLKSQTSEFWEHPRGIFYRQTGLDLQGKVVALFSGQGSQYLDMGYRLAANFPEIRQAFGQMDGFLVEDGLQPVSEVVYAPPVFTEEDQQRQEQLLQRTEYAQPAIGAFSTGLYKILAQAGLKPDFVAGHSFGELTALWVAGILSETDYCRLVKARGQAMAAPADPAFDAGTMLAVKGDASTIESLVQAYPEVAIANFNSSQQLVLAGPKAAIATVQSVLEERGFSPIPLPVSAAFHTALVSHAQVPFSQAVSQVTFNPPQIPVYTNVTGQPYPSEPAAMQALLQQHMVSQVQFKQEIENIYAAGGRCFIEFGPKQALTNLVKEILGEQPHLAVALNASRHKDSDCQLREALVQLRVAGLALAEFDPYQLPLSRPAAEVKGKQLTVQINGASYVSEKTRSAYEKSLQDSQQLLQLSAAQAEPLVMATSSTAKANHANGNGNGAAKANHANGNGNGAAKANHANGNGNGAAKANHANGNGNAAAKANHANGNGNAAAKANHANGNGNGAAKKAADVVHTPKTLVDMKTSFIDRPSLATNGQATPAHSSTSKEASMNQSPTPNQSSTKANGQPNLSSLDQVLVQFSQHQSQIARTHEQYLENHRAYTQAFYQLAQQQQQLLSHTNGNRADAETVSSTERNLMAFHAHQQETLRVHESYLVHQIDCSKHFFQLGQTACQISMPEAAVAQSVSVPPSVAATPATLAPTPVEQPVTAPSVTTVMDIPAVEPITETIAEPIIAINPVEMQSKLLAVVSDKTGYPVEMLDLDMDMEADLGIDSIKRVEILGALQEQFPGMPQPNLEEMAEIELRTLGQVADFMQSLMAAATGVAPVVEPIAAAPVVEPVAAAPVVEPVAAAPVVEPVAATPVVEPVAATPVVEPAEMQSKLLAVVSDKTGYPVEMLELDMDMEADLGIDSIKRVEILGALQEQFPGMPQPNLEEMAEIELRTLGQVADFMQTLLAAPAAAAPVVPATPTSEPAVLPTPAVVAPVAAAVTAVQETPAAAPVVTATAVLERPVTITAPTVDPAEMQSKLLAVVSDKTGYPVEMLELDMDIEADLGIDSIKRVEILGALQEQFPGMPQPNLEEMAEIELRTLGQVADFMQSLLAAPEKKNDSGELGNFSLELETLPLPRSQAQLKFLPSPDWLEFEIPQGHTCVLTDDGSAVTAQLAQRLLDQGAKVVVLSFPKTLVPQSTALPQGVQQVMLEDFSDDALEKTLDQIATREGSPAVFIHLHPAISANASVDSMFSETDAAIVKQVFFMAKHLKQFLTQAATQGRSAFLTVARLDGTFGLSQQNPFNAIPAGLLGLTKTLNYEWPSVYCRALDVSPALSVEQLVDCILAELHDPDQRFAEVAYGVSGRTTLMAA